LREIFRKKAGEFLIPCDIIVRVRAGAHTKERKLFDVAFEEILRKIGMLIK